MIVTARHVAEAVLVLVLIVLGFEYIKAREDRVRMDATLAAQKTVIDKAESDRQQHAKEDAARDAATAATIQSMQALVAGLKTPQQQVAWSQSQLIDAIKGIQISVNPKTGEAEAVIPKESIAQLPAVIEHCKECDVKLATTQADLQSRIEQQQLADLQIKALQNERDSAVRAAKGGTWIQKTGRALKYIAIGGAIGYVAAKH